MKRPTKLAVLTAALVVLLPALAILQYVWVGQIADATRERMQRNLHNAAQQFRDSFEAEVTRAFLGLQVDSAVARDEAWPRYAERYAAWASTTAYPKLIANVYLIDALAGELRLRRWDAQMRTFVSAEWHGDLEGTRAHFASELAAFAAGDRRRPERRPFEDRESLLIAPLINIHFGPPPQAQMHASLVTVFGFTVLELNLPLIREQVLPALARRHFSPAADEGYRVAVVDATNSKQVVYRSSPDAPIEAAHADVNVPLLTAQHDPVMFFTQGVARDAVQPGDRRNVVVIREQRDNTVMMRARMANADAGRWRLLAQHERGSLDTAVAGVRQRNLLVSFGILILMAVSIVLLALSSRRAQRLAQQQLEFVAGVSHELRTPVAVIRSAAENLSHGVVSDHEAVKRYGNALQVEARRLGEMVERVLQFAGIESGRIVRAALPVEPLLTEAVAEALRHEGQALTVVYDIAADLPPVFGDSAALRSAIQNLVTNAVKYGGVDRWIRVRAHAAPRPARYAEAPEVLITVEDHGSGIPSSDLPHIFDPFYRGENARSRQIQGSGLGLALVRRIAQAHGGRVSVETREDAGTAFTLHLPTAGVIHDKPSLFRSPNEAAAG